MCAPARLRTLIVCFLFFLFWVAPFDLPPPRSRGTPQSILPPPPPIRSSVFSFIGYFFVIFLIICCCYFLTCFILCVCVSLSRADRVGTIFSGYGSTEFFLLHSICRSIHSNWGLPLFLLRHSRKNSAVMKKTGLIFPPPPFFFFLVNEIRRHPSANLSDGIEFLYPPPLDAILVFVV